MIIKMRDTYKGKKIIHPILEHELEVPGLGDLIIATVSNPTTYSGSAERLPFKVMLEEIVDAGARIACIRDIAYARTHLYGMLRPKLEEYRSEVKDLDYHALVLRKERFEEEHRHTLNILRIGNYTREAFVYLPNEEILLVRDSPILKYPDLAEKLQYFLPEKILEGLEKQAEEDSGKPPEERRVFRFNPRNFSVYKPNPHNFFYVFPTSERVNPSICIPANKIKDEEVTRWFFQDQAAVYGGYIKKYWGERWHPHGGLPIYFKEPAAEPFLRQANLVRVMNMNERSATSPHGGIDGAYDFTKIDLHFRAIKEFNIGSKILQKIMDFYKK